MTETSTFQNSRLFYLDWLRILAFGVLVITNCAEVFAGTHWWIANNKTDQTIADVLVFFRQWRMPLLFIISGFAISIMLQKKSILQFIDDRFTRILIPLLAGMLLVIPPMIFYIWLAKGSIISVGQFYLSMLNLEWFPKGNIHWLHLWYLAFIFIFSMAILPLIIYLRDEKHKLQMAKLYQFISRPSVLFLSVLFFHLPYYISDNLTYNSNFSSLLYYLPYFVFGTLFFSNHQVRETFLVQRKTALIAGVIATGLLYYFLWLKVAPANTSINSSLMELVQGPLRSPLISLNQWFWVIAFAGFAIRYLNFGNKFLSYSNRVVYPFYILHQPIIIIISYYLIPVDTSISIKFCVILTGTMLTVLAFYELILKRFTILKLMFGIKTNIRLLETFPRSAGLLNKIMPQLSRVSEKPLDPS